jgi:hypothetical protein
MLLHRFEAIGCNGGCIGVWLLLSSVVRWQACGFFFPLRMLCARPFPLFYWFSVLRLIWFWRRRAVAAPAQEKKDLGNLVFLVSGLYLVRGTRFLRSHIANNPEVRLAPRFISRECDTTKTTAEQLN